MLRKETKVKNTKITLSDGNQVEFTETKKIGEGGMGIVFCGEVIQKEKRERLISVGPLKIKNTKTEKVRKLCAIKKMSNKDTANRQEVSNSATLSKAHIGSAVVANDIYIVMDYLHGETLDKLIEKGKTAHPLVNNLQLIDDLIAEVKDVHEKGYAHRDIKPSNFMVNEGGRASLFDWGSACRNGDIIDTNVGVTKGYCPPEVLFFDYCDLDKLFAKEYETTTGKALPDDWRKDGEIKKAYSAFRDNLRHVPYTQAADVYALCLTIAETLGFTRIGKLNDRYPEFTDKDNAWKYDKDSFEHYQVPTLKNRDTLKAEYNPDIHPWPKEIYDEIIDFLYEGTDWDSAKRPTVHQIQTFFNSVRERVNNPDLISSPSPISVVKFQETDAQEKKDQDPEINLPKQRRPRPISEKKLTRDDNQKPLTTKSVGSSEEAKQRARKTPSVGSSKLTSSAADEKRTPVIGNTPLIGNRRSTSHSVKKRPLRNTIIYKPTTRKEDFISEKKKSRSKELSGHSAILFRPKEQRIKSSLISSGPVSIIEDKSNNILKLSK